MYTSLRGFKDYINQFLKHIQKHPCKADQKLKWTPAKRHEINDSTKSVNTIQLQARIPSPFNFLFCIEV